MIIKVDLFKNFIEGTTLNTILHLLYYSFFFYVYSAKSCHHNAVAMVIVIFRNTGKYNCRYRNRV